MTAIPAYPLHWPDGWKRTAAPARTVARFTKKERQHHTRGDGSSYTSERARELSIADAVERVRRELGTMGIGDEDLVISTNVPLRLDGWPRSSTGEPEDPGAVAYWRTRKGEQRCMAIDRYTRVADNLAAIAATLEALRAIERHGGAEILDRAFRGFAALPAPGQSCNWRDVLGVKDPNDDSLASRKEQYQWARTSYRGLAAKHHPDKGGDAEEFKKLTNAWKQAQNELGFLADA